VRVCLSFSCNDNAALHRWIGCPDDDLFDRMDPACRLIRGKFGAGDLINPSLLPAGQCALPFCDNNGNIVKLYGFFYILFLLTRENFFSFFFLVLV
jgi:hypothetical protein